LTQPWDNYTITRAKKDK